MLASSLFCFPWPWTYLDFGELPTWSGYKRSNLFPLEGSQSDCRDALLHHRKDKPSVYWSPDSSVFGTSLLCLRQRVMLGMGLGLQCGQHRWRGGILPPRAQLGVGARLECRGGEGRVGVGGWAWPVPTAVSMCSSPCVGPRPRWTGAPTHSCWPQPLEWGVATVRIPVRSGRCTLQTRATQTDPPFLAFLFSSPLQSHNEKCYWSQIQSSYKC